MEKEYRYSTVYKAVLLTIMLISTYGLVELVKPYGLLLIYISIAGMVWFVLLGFRYKIVIAEDYIVVDVGRLGKRVEYNWKQISRVSRIPFFFMWMYKIHCKDKTTLTFTNSIANYKDLLREIVERSPYAEVDDSIKKLLECK